MLMQGTHIFFVGLTLSCDLSGDSLPSNKAMYNRPWRERQSRLLPIPFCFPALSPILPATVKRRCFRQSLHLLMMTTTMAAKSPAGGGGDGGDGRWLCWSVAPGEGGGGRPVNLGSLFSVFGVGEEEENGRLEEKNRSHSLVQGREKWLVNHLKQDPSFFKIR